MIEYLKTAFVMACIGAGFAAEMKYNFGGNRGSKNPEKRPARRSNYGVGLAVKLIGTSEPKMIVESVSGDSVHVRWVQEWNGTVRYHRDIYPDSMLTRWDSPLAGASSQLKF